MGQANLPLASGDKHARAFERLGWERQPKRGKGSHIILTRPGVRWTISLPGVAEVKRGLLAKQIAGAGLTEQEYLDAFR